MPMYRINGLLVWFSHIPKTGGSSLHDVIADASDEVRFFDDNWTHQWRRQGGWKNRAERSSPQHMTWQDAQGRLGPVMPDLRFAVTRHPVSRLVSEYHYQSLRGRGRNMLTKLGFSRWLRLSLAAVRHDRHYMDNHFLNQSDFVDDSFQTFRFEDGLDAVIMWLQMQTGVNFASIPRKKTHSGTKVTASAADAALIESEYMNDFRCFGYLRSMEDCEPPRLDRTTYLLGRSLACAYARGYL